MIDLQWLLEVWPDLIKTECTIIHGHTNSECIEEIKV
jgi:hypothetical protein